MPAPPNRLTTLNNLPLHTFRAKLWPPNDPCFQPTPTPTHEQQSWRLQLRTSTGLSDAEFTTCYRLVRDTSSADYKASPEGWDPVRKRREMRLLDLRYVLLGRCSVGDEGVGLGLPVDGVDLGLPVDGFLSFMLTWEDGVEVIYCYEIHLDGCVRGRGMGERMMGLLEEVGRKAEVEKAMLTVFKKNQAAVRFYERLGYEEDEYSPRPKKLRNGVVKELDYLIMSKSLIRAGKKHEEERQKKRKAG